MVREKLSKAELFAKYYISDLRLCRSFYSLICFILKSAALFEKVSYVEVAFY